MKPYALFNRQMKMLNYKNRIYDISNVLFIGYRTLSNVFEKEDREEIVNAIAKCRLALDEAEYIYECSNEAFDKYDELCVEEMKKLNEIVRGSNAEDK